MAPVVYLISDLHLGAGLRPDGTYDPLEDFFADAALDAFLRQIAAAHADVELVIAGDFIDFTQVLPELAAHSPENGLGSSQAESVARCELVLGKNPARSGGHPQVFQALRRFMAEGHSITIVVGNHDVDLLWPDVWGRVFDAIYPAGSPGVLRRVAYSLTLGSNSQRVYIEHGQERDVQNAFGDELRDMFSEDMYGVQRLRRCWGTLFVDTVYNRLEAQRWFIDNVKPLSRVVLAGLANDTAFTAGALARIAQFFLIAGAPPQRTAVLGDIAEPLARTPEGVTGAIEDQRLRAALEERLADPQFRAGFQQELQQFDQQEWDQMAAGKPFQPSLEGMPDVGAALLDPHQAAVLGVSVPTEDSYRAAAREVLAADPSIGWVVMGHTHDPIDGRTKPVDLSGGRSGYYFNSGTWISHLANDREYTWDELANRANYRADLTFLRMLPRPDGGYDLELDSWARTWQQPIYEQGTDGG